MSHQELHDRSIKLAQKLRRLTISTEQRSYGIGAVIRQNSFSGARNQLNKAATELVGAVGSHARKEVIAEIARELEGYLLVGKTTEVLPEKEADKALGEVQDFHTAIAAL